MRIVFLGSGAFGVPTLARVAAEHDVPLIVSQPDRPAGRSRALTPTPIGVWAAERGVETIKPENVNEAPVVERIRAARPDALVVIAFGQYLGRAVREAAWAVNLHGSRLPRWRGAAPINHAILAGDAETGNSVIAVARTMDAGDVFGITSRPIPPTVTAGELHDLLSADGPDLVLRVLEERARGAERGQPQDEVEVTIAPKLSKADGWVDFARPAEECRRRVHGLTPWPGVTARLGGEDLKLLRAEAGTADNQQGEPGEIVDGAAGLVACGGGTALRLLEVQPPGKRAMRWEEFARGRQIKPGARMEGRSAC